MHLKIQIRPKQSVNVKDYMQFFVSKLRCRVNVSEEMVFEICQFRLGSDYPEVSWIYFFKQYP